MTLTEMLMSCRYTEEKAAARKPTRTGPTPTPSQRELSDGTDETLRLYCSLPWFFLVPTMGALHSKELPLPPIAKFKELATGLISLDKAQSVVLGLTNSLSTSGLRARLAVVHSAFIGNE